MKRKGLTARLTVLSASLVLAFFLQTEAARAAEPSKEQVEIQSTVNSTENTGNEATSSSNEETDKEESSSEKKASSAEESSVEEEGTSYRKAPNRSPAAQSSYTRGVQEKDGKLYLYDETGTLRQDNAWVSFEGNYYFPNAEGVLYRDQLITFGSHVAYYLDHNGRMRTGFQEINGKLMYFRENGVLAKDNQWISTDRGWVFPNAQGVVYRDQFITFGSKVAYYLKHDGTYVTGFQEINGKLMYFRENGVLAKDNQWISTDRGWVFPNAQGIVYRDQFITFGSKVAYYLKHDGTYVTDFQEINGNLMYFRENGVLAKDNKWVNTKNGWVFPNAQGVLYRNRFISFGADKKYYLNPNGILQTGMVEANGTVYDVESNGLLKMYPHSYVYQGKWYFANEKGEPYRNRFISFGKVRYLMGEDGSRQTGMVPFQGTVYRLDASGELVRESSSYDYNGKTYFAKPDGTPYRDQVLTFGPSYAMYMGEDGAKQYGLCAGKNNAYYADTNTGNLLRNYGLFQINNEVYHSGTTFALTRGWKKVNGDLFYFDTQAKYPSALKNMVRTIDGRGYRFDAYGRATQEATYSVAGEWSYTGGYLTGPAVSDRFVGENFAVVSLRHQYMWVFSGGELAVATPIISGKPSTPTVRGNFYVQGMTKGTYLTGPTWRSWVDYWVPFYGDYGIHDAPWQYRDNFYKDSESYTWVGSHGCVNVLPSVMPRVYDALYTGSAVTVY